MNRPFGVLASVRYRHIGSSLNTAVYLVCHLSAPCPTGMELEMQPIAFFFSIPLQAWIGFGGLGVACWPVVPKFAGSNPAEAVGFLERKNPQHAFLRRGSKAVGPMS